MRRIIYRNTSNGRFVKQSTWKRSLAQGGTKYKRQSIEIKKEEEKVGGEPGIVLPIESLEEYEEIDESEYEDEDEIGGGIDTGKAKKK